MKLSPTLTGLRTYPFVRLDDAKRRLQAEGVDFVDFGVGEPREETPAFIREALIAAGGLVRAPKQAWTPVAEFGVAGLPAVNFGPGDPAQAHRRDESVEVAALVRSHEVLERFAA